MTRLHPVIDEAMRSDGLTHDQWGTCLTVLGALCDVISAAGGEVEIPAGVGYSSSPLAPWNAYRAHDTDSRFDSFWPDDGSGEYDLQRDIVVALERHREPDRFVTSMRAMTMSDVAFAVRLLDRYADLLRQAGEDY